MPFRKLTKSLSVSKHDGIFHKTKLEDHSIREKERKDRKTCYPSLQINYRNRNAVQK
jgi:hypothetical protein